MSLRNHTSHISQMYFIRVCTSMTL
jgi:hypothetical protein